MVIILTLFVFLGIGVITFSNNSPDSGVPEDPEAIEYFIPDLAGTKMSSTTLTSLIMPSS
jgi:hypothetical protein